MAGSARGRIAAALLVLAAGFTAFGPPGDFVLAAFWAGAAAVVLALDYAASRRD